MTSVASAPATHARAIGERARRLSADVWAVALLVALTLLIGWHLSHFDAWLEQLDISNFFINQYGYLGKRLREWQVPGWNPYLSSGTPFAGDPQSGWMYLPAMLLFPFLAPVLAFKLLVGLQFLISGLSMYAFARVMRLGPLASLAAAFIFEFHPFANSPSYCCTNRLQVWTWVPLMLLGVELAVRARSWEKRVMPWCLSAFALSQIYSVWFGQGMVYALLVFASFVAYRVLFGDEADARPVRDRLAAGITTGAAPLLISAGLSAAGLLPRLVISRETLLGEGDYGELPGSLIKSPSLRKLILNIIGSDNAPRGIAIGGAALVLVVVAPVLARRAHATFYFAGLTVASYMLMLRVSPLHYVIYLIPRLQAIHSHNTINVSAIGAIGPAMLAGAAIQALPRCRIRPSRAALAALPLVAIVVALLTLGPHGITDAGLTQIGAALATAVVIAALIWPRRVGHWAPIALIALILALPTGVQLVSAWLGSPAPSPWQAMGYLDPEADAAVAALTGSQAPNQAGGFLQAQMAASGPFRFAGYTTVTVPPKVRGNQPSYVSNRRNPYVLAILTNGRAIPLELDDVSAYNPIQLKRYVRLISLINSKQQNYHTTFLTARGFSSHLLGALDVRYVLVDRRLAAENSLLASILQGRHPVYSDHWVTVYESDAPGSHAWIVHQVKRTRTKNVLRALSPSSFDPKTMAIVEGDPFKVEPLPPGAADQATVTLDEPERVRVDATVASAGLLVVSETYESGWKAYVDGKEAAIRPTDYALRGVPLSAGHHIVEFRYEPASLAWGLWITGFTCAAVIAATCWRGWARRRGDPPDIAPSATRAATTWPSIDGRPSVPGTG
jgi:hypothetical protein